MHDEINSLHLSYKECQQEKLNKPLFLFELINLTNLDFAVVVVLVHSLKATKKGSSSRAFLEELLEGG